MLRYRVAHRNDRNLTISIAYNSQISMSSLVPQNFNMGTQNLKSYVRRKVWLFSISRIFKVE